MRILFVTPNLGIGGVQRQWSILAPGLRERGHDVTVLALDAGGPFANELGARGVEVTCIGLHSRTDVKRLRRALAASAWRPDVVVSHSVSAQIVAALIARRTRAPHVVADHAALRVDGSRRPLRRHQAALVRAVAPRVEQVVAVTEASRGALEAAGYPAARICVIPNGVDAAVPTPGRRALVRGQLGIPRGVCVVLLAAALRPEKRLDVFADALPRAREHAPIVGLVAGDGPAMLSLLSRRDEGLLVLGRRTDVPALIEASDVVCLTSDAEALPMIVLEAMAAARPVVATDVGGTREAVVDGITGYVVAPGDVESTADRLGTLAAHPLLRERLGFAGAERHRERFSTEDMVDRYDALLRAVAAA